MTRLIVCVFTGAAILAQVCAADAQTADDKRTPIERFKGATLFGLKKCQLMAELYLIKPDAGAFEQALQCISAGRESAKREFAAAAKSQKKPKAAEALKDYYAAWMAAIDGVVPDQGESGRDYRKRQGDAERRARELWGRYEIEAGL